MAQSRPPVKGDFHASYTAANLSKDAVPYNFVFFNNLKEKLDEADPEYLGSFSCALMVPYSALSVVLWK